MTRSILLRIAAAAMVGILTLHGGPACQLPDHSRRVDTWWGAA